MITTVVVLLILTLLLYCFWPSIKVALSPMIPSVTDRPPAVAWRFVYFLHLRALAVDLKACKTYNTLFGYATHSSRDLSAIVHRLERLEGRLADELSMRDRLMALMEKTDKGLASLTRSQSSMVDIVSTLENRASATSQSLQNLEASIPMQISDVVDAHALVTSTDLERINEMVQRLSQDVARRTESAALRVIAEKMSAKLENQQAKELVELWRSVDSLTVMHSKMQEQDEVARKHGAEIRGLSSQCDDLTSEVQSNKRELEAMGLSLARVDDHVLNMTDNFAELYTI
ncbi:hypothetical protein B0H13DRAFT_2265711 [Mycena leptocephala]|nr:hypothetical protein B0H13DRAFT_2265711 [Mycena leptocephala]